MGYQRRFLGGPLSGVEDRSESDEVSESVEAEDGDSDPFLRADGLERYRLKEWMIEPPQ